MSFKLYSDQQQTVDRAVEILSETDWVYLALECQIGKTLISLAIAQEIQAESVLVVTLKNVVKGRGFEDDYDMQGNNFELATINYESAHKYSEHPFDVLIIDEAHSLGAFPKMTKRSEVLRKLKEKAAKVIYLSATPTPESYSQWFHQLIGVNSPLSVFKNFYRFKDVWVNVKEKKVSATRSISDYSDCKVEINDLLKPNIISMTYDYAMFTRWVNRELPQSVAELRYEGVFNVEYLGKRFRLNDRESYYFDGKTVIVCEDGHSLKESKVEDCFIHVETKNEIVKGCFTVMKKLKSGVDDDYQIEEQSFDSLPLVDFQRILERDKCIYVNDELVTVESGASMLSKVSQLSSGVIIDDESNTHILSELKVSEGLKNFDPEKRLAIFYFFVGEKAVIKSVLGDDVTDDLSKFQSGEVKHFMVHFRSGKAGIRLSCADELVMVNVPHSYEQFYQARQRRSSLLKEGKELKVWWIFSTHGIEKKVFNVVKSKEDYTLKHYRNS